MMKLPNLKAWWRGLPQKKRVEYIAAFLLLFAGTEVLVMAPFVLDLALLIDTFGVIFVLRATRAAWAGSWVQLTGLFRRITRPVGAGLRVLESFADFGARAPMSWLVRYSAIEGLAARGTAAAMVAALGLVVVRVASVS